MSARTPTERRRQPRVVLDCPLSVHLPEGRFEARLRDVSNAGVCFFLDRRIPEMTVLELSLPLPDTSTEREQTIRGSGVVVRCQPVSPRVDHFEIAIFLNHLDDSNRERLARFVDERVPA